MLLTDAPFDSGALRDGNGFRPVDCADLDETQCKLFIKAGVASQPKWVSDLKSLADNEADLDALRAQSSSAVLLLDHEDTIFALTFGNGFQAIDPSKIQRGFGLRVTANAVVGTALKSADTRALNRGGRSQKVIMPAASELQELGIDVSEDWVRQLSGTASSTEFATTTAGADSLRLSIKDFTIQDLPDKLQQIKQYYNSDDYKQQLGFIDNFVRLDPKDPMIEDLDAEIAAEVLAGSDDIFFAAPDPFEQLNVDHFVIVCRKRIPVEELGQADIYDALNKLNIPSEDPLRKVSIQAQDANNNPIDKRYKLYDYIQAELQKDDGRYVLNAGIWFRVSESYVQEVGRRMATIADITEVLRLPEWNKDADGKHLAEGDYNDALGDTEAYAKLDKDNLQFGQHQKVEICDLVDVEKRLICVKRATRSSTLSHLFAQGSVSAALMHETRYQDKLMGKLQTIDQDAKWGNSSDWTIVYAIGTEKPGALAQSLFFFSQIALITHVEAIRSRNIKVAIARIQC